MESRWRSLTNKTASVEAATAQKTKQRITAEDKAKLPEPTEHKHQGGKENEEQEANPREIY